MNQFSQSINPSVNKGLTDSEDQATVDPVDDYEAPAEMIYITPYDKRSRIQLSDESPYFEYD